MKQQGQKPIRNPLEELTEIVKTAGEQAGVKAPAGEQQQTAPQTEAPLPQPSLIERKKNRMMMANRTELEQLQAQARRKREQQELQAKTLEEQGEKQEEQMEVKKKQSFFERGLELVKRRARGKMETRQPKAA